MTVSDKLPTIAMTPVPDLYDPIPAILSGAKTQTLRKRAVRGECEVTVNRQRTGIVLRFTGSVGLPRAMFLTDDFAQKDGLADWQALEELLIGFYGEVPEQMVCSHFEVVTASAANPDYDPVAELDARLTKGRKADWTVNEAGQMEPAE